MKKARVYFNYYFSFDVDVPDEIDVEGEIIPVDLAEKTGLLGTWLDENADVPFEIDWDKMARAEGEFTDWRWLK